MTTKLAVDLTGRGTILLAEDDESLRLLIARGLRSRGFDVIEASNGLEHSKRWRGRTARSISLSPM